MTFSRWDELVKLTNKAEVEAKTAADWARQKWAEAYKAREIAEKAQLEAEIAGQRMRKTQETLEEERLKMSKKVTEGSWR
jgi:hypothetical protein